MTGPRRVSDLAIAEFVARVRRQRVEDGQPPYITDERVYRLLDGLMADRPKDDAS